MLFLFRILSWFSCSLAAFLYIISTFCRSTEVLMYCRYSCFRRYSWKLSVNLYTFMMSSTFFTCFALRVFLVWGVWGEGLEDGVGRIGFWVFFMDEDGLGLLG